MATWVYYIFLLGYSCGALHMIWAHWMSKGAFKRYLERMAANDARSKAAVEHVRKHGLGAMPTYKHETLR